VVLIYSTFEEFMAVQCTEAGTGGLKWLRVMKYSIENSIILLEHATSFGPYTKKCSRSE